jgi:hypothetical protein
MKTPGKKVYIVYGVHDGILGVYGNVKQAYSQAKLYASNQELDLSYNMLCSKFKKGYIKINLDIKSDAGINEPMVRVYLRNLNEDWI